MAMLKGRDTPLQTSKKMRLVAVRTGVRGPNEPAKIEGTSILVEPCGDSTRIVDTSSIEGCETVGGTHPVVGETSA